MYKLMLFRQNILIVLISLGLIFISSISLAADIQVVNNQLLPNIHWQDGEGKIYSLNDTHGKPRLLHFWAAWCIPCREEMPKMLEWQSANNDILVIPLSMDQRMAQSRYFIKKFKLNMPVLLVNEDDRKKINVPVLPYTLLVSKDGTQVGHVKGIAAWDDKTFINRIRLLLK